MKLINLVLKWLAQLAVALSAGLLVIIFFATSPNLSAFLLRLLILLAVAFMGSFSGRLFFNALPAIMLVVLTFLTNVISVLIIDHFYQSTYQFNFIDQSYALQPPNVSDLSQALLMLLVSLLPLLMFRRLRSRPQHARFTLPDWKATWLRFSQRTTSRLRSFHPRNWGIWQKIRLLKKKSPLKSALRTTQPRKKTAQATPVLKVNSKSSLSKIGHQTGGSSQTPIKPARTSSLRKKPTTLKIPIGLFGKSNHDVKLVGEEEHVCPYCLDQVTKNDNHGIKICPECGTWHHQDCWNLTGACGVAHRNEL